LKEESQAANVNNNVFAEHSSIQLFTAFNMEFVELQRGKRKLLFNGFGYVKI